MTSTVSITTAAALDVALLAEAGFTNLLGALRSGGRLAVVSRDEPDGMHAVLAHVGFVDVSRVALAADDAGPVWLASADRRD